METSWKRTWKKPICLAGPPGVYYYYYSPSPQQPFRYGYCTGDTEYVDSTQYETRYSEYDSFTQFSAIHCALHIPLRTMYHFSNPSAILPVASSQALFPSCCSTALEFSPGPTNLSSVQVVGTGQQDEWRFLFGSTSAGSIHCFKLNKTVNP